MKKLKINKQQVKDCYNAFSKDYDKSTIYNTALTMDHPIIIDLLKKELDKNSIGLDLGCGTGILTLKIADFVKKIVGLDISSQMIEKAKSKINHDILNIKLKQFDISQKTSFKDNHLDFVVSALVVCHIQNINNLYREIYRILKPSGVFVFDDLTSQLNKPFHLKHKDYLGKFSTNNVKLWKKRKPEDHIKLLKIIGFKIENIIKTKIDKRVKNTLTQEDYKLNLGCQFTTIIKVRKSK